MHTIHMDTDRIIEHARARFAHESARRMLKEKYQAKMLFAYQGGMWQAGPELIVLLSSCDQDDIVLLDLYDTPITVNRLDLLTMAQQRWQEQMTAWEIEHQAQSRSR